MTMSSIKLIIHIPDSKDPRLGYLSNSSLHPIEIEGHTWMSVEHYLIWKMYENTNLEKEIRLSRNILKVKMLCKPKRVSEIDSDGRTIRKYTYSKGNNRSDLDKLQLEIKNKHLLSAIQAKFDQNPSIKKKLLDTHGTTIVDKCDASLGIALMKIRDTYIENCKSAFQGSLSKNGISSQLDDLKDPMDDDTLNQEKKNIIDGLIRIALIIKDKEGLDNLYYEMFEDVLYNIGLGESLYSIFDTWIKEITKDWSRVMSKTPKFYSLFKNIEKYILFKKLPGYSDEDCTSTALILSTFIKWYQDEESGNLAKTVVSNIFILRPDNITIAAKPRKYRRLPPGRVHHEIGQKTKIVFKDHYGDITIIMDPSERSIVLRIDIMEEYKPHIINAGGKITSSTTAEFHPSKLSSVEDMIYSSLTSTDEKYDMICRCWARKRISILDDVRSLVFAGLQVDEKQNNADMNLKNAAKLLGLHFLTFPAEFTGTKWGPPDYIITEIKDRGMPIVLSRKLCHHLVPTSQEGRKIIIDAILSGATKTNVMKLLDKVCGWRHEDIHRKTDIPSLVCNSIFQILNSMENLDLEYQMNAFMILLPKDLRNKAQTYIKEYSKIQKKENVTQKGEDFVYDAAKSFILQHMKNGLSTTRILDRCKLFGFKIKDSTPTDKTTSNPGSNDQTFSSGAENPVVRSGAKGPERSNLNTTPQVDSNKKIPNKDETLKIEGRVIECEGNILTFTDSKWLCVVANTTSLTLPKKPGTRSEIITRCVYEKYTYSNVYAAPDRSKAYTPGEIIISLPRDRMSGIQLSSTVDHRYIITLLAEFASGGPKKITDTKQTRFNWFSDAVNKMSSELKNGDTIAFSSSSLMEGYLQILIELAKKIGIVIYILTDLKDVLNESSHTKNAVNDTVDPVYTGLTPIPFDVTQLDNEGTRGGLYIKLFKGIDPNTQKSILKLTSDQYSKIVESLEKMPPDMRKTWLIEYSKSKSSTKKNMVKNMISKATSDPYQMI